MSNVQVAEQFIRSFIENDTEHGYDEYVFEDDLLSDVALDIEGIEADTLFAWGEFSQLLVAVKDSKVVGFAVGGFEDNRGAAIDYHYTVIEGVNKGQSVEENIDLADLWDDDAEYSRIYNEMIQLLTTAK